MHRADNRVTEIGIKQHQIGLHIFIHMHIYIYIHVHSDTKFGANVADVWW